MHNSFLHRKVLSAMVARVLKPVWTGEGHDVVRPMTCSNGERRIILTFILKLCTSLVFSSFPYGRKDGGGTFAYFLR